MVVAQHGMMGTNMQSPVDTSYLADSVVLLRYFEYAGKVKKAISVVKKRSGAHEESIRELRFDEKGIHLSEPLAQFPRHLDRRSHGNHDGQNRVNLIRMSPNARKNR